MGASFQAIPPSASSRFPAVAYDPASDSYLVVTGIAKSSARFVSATGVALGAADSVNTGGAGATGVGCASISFNACLVAWVQEPSTIMARLIRSNGGNLQYLTAPFPISSSGLKANAAAPGVAAAASGEFLVVWQTPVGDLLGQRVTPLGALEGGQITVAQAAGHFEMLPTLAYNSAQDEYMVGFYDEAPSGSNGVGMQRVKPGTGALLGRTTVYSRAFAQYPEIAYNSQENQYLAITWGEGVNIHGALADGNGNALPSGVQVMAAGGLGDGIGLAYNPVSNTYLAVFMTLLDEEVWAAEISKTGVPGAKFKLTDWGSSAAHFSTQPSVAGSTKDQRFLAAASAGYEWIVGQMAQTLTSGGPRVTLSGDLAFGRVVKGRTVTKTLQITNAGSTSVTVLDINYPAGFSSTWTMGVVAPGATQDVAVKFSPTATGNYGGTVSVQVDPSTASVSTTASGTGARPIPGDYDANLVAEFAVYRPSTSKWNVRNTEINEVVFGERGDIPIPGDYDGDGAEGLAVYRPSTSTWIVRDLYTVQWGQPGDVPVPGDYDGDGDTDVAVYRPSTGDWYVKDQFTVTHYGGGGYLPVPADYDGDGRTDVAVYRPSTGFWYVRNQFIVPYGSPGDLPVPADYSGDGAADVAVYRPTTGMWFVRNRFTLSYGSLGDLPVPGDFNGDGTADIAIYRADTGLWFVRGLFDAGVAQGGPGDIPVPRQPYQMRAAIVGDFDGDGSTDVSVYRPSTGGWFVRDKFNVQFGDPGDVPVQADYDGDRAIDVAVYRPSSGRWFVLGKLNVQYGDAGDRPVPGDYNGDGVADIAVYRPSTGMWYVRGLMAVQFGDSGDIPVPADYDGDGVTNVAVYRPSTGQWFVRGQFVAQFGDNGDVPVPADYNGDGATDIAVYRPATGQWFVRGQFTVQYGDSGDVPVPGDYNGDGAIDIAVYRPSTGMWFVRNRFWARFGDSNHQQVVYYRPE
jgi:hypothetical protein